jgi:hypothetical protein
MKTNSWQQSAIIDNVSWDLVWFAGRINLFGNSKPVMTVGSDGETRVLDGSVKIPNAVVDALISMNRVRIEEAGR